MYTTNDFMTKLDMNIKHDYKSYLVCVVCDARIKELNMQVISVAKIILSVKSQKGVNAVHSMALVPFWFSADNISLESQKATIC